MPRFNPHPARRPDAMSQRGGPRGSPSKFQSSPGPKAGCYLPRSQPGAIVPGFNPHPARRPDAICKLHKKAGQGNSFNPHPARRPDAILDLVVATHIADECFNPHPARRPDAIPRSVTDISIGRWFQSSPGPKAGCYDRPRRSRGHRHQVSILTRPEGRML